jgi:glycerate 2-kinase
LRLLPMSDGGDGFGEVMGRILGAATRRVPTINASHQACTATWWYSNQNSIIESARVVGLAMLPPGKFHPFELDTFGLAEVLRRVAASGSRRCLIGIGGSATNDGGFGLARALGWTFLDARGGRIEQWADLGRLRSVRPPARRFGILELTVAVDVQNPLLGPKGATWVYGPQKGLSGDDLARAEICLKQLAAVVADHLGNDLSKAPGAGAAGGLGFGLKAFLGAHLEPGFDVFAAKAGLEAHFKWADAVLTGEGRIDRSTLMGKGVGELAFNCLRFSIPCFGLAGVVEVQRQQNVFTRLGALTECATVEEASQRPGYWLTRLTAKMARESFP